MLLPFLKILFQFNNGLWHKEKVTWFKTGLALCTTMLALCWFQLLIRDSFQLVVVLHTRCRPCVTWRKKRFVRRRSNSMLRTSSEKRVTGEEQKASAFSLLLVRRGARFAWIYTRNAHTNGNIYCSESFCTLYASRSSAQSKKRIATVWTKEKKSDDDLNLPVDTVGGWRHYTRQLTVQQSEREKQPEREIITLIQWGL